jgi:hypothetical protein
VGPFALSGLGKEELLYNRGRFGRYGLTRLTAGGGGEMDQAAEKTAAEKTAGQRAYDERLKRLVDAVELREPDRVPVSLGLSYFPAKFTGGEAWDAFYDFPKWRAAYLAAAREYEPDRLLLVPSACGRTLEAVEARQTKWPGHGVARHHTHQFVEGEYMKEDEYDLFLNDMSDFLVRIYLPRAYGSWGPGEAPPSLPLQHAPLQHPGFRRLRDDAGDADGSGARDGALAATLGRARPRGGGSGLFLRHAADGGGLAL